eukprot:scaffold9114_cov118-Isochrysis_galbana.AAC.16
MGSKPLTPNVSEAVAKDLFGTSISHTKSPRGPAGQASDLEAVDLEMGQDIPGGSAQQASHGLYSRFTCWLGCCHGNGPEQKNASFTTINGVHVITPPRPSVDVARKYASTRLARQRQGDENPGELYPLYTPLQTFDRFGTDISQYMHFIYYTSRLFFCLFFLNLSNLVINMEGGNLSFLKLGSAEAGVNPLAVLHTIGNTETTGVLAKGAGFTQRRMASPRRTPCALFAYALPEPPSGSPPATPHPHTKPPTPRCTSSPQPVPRHPCCVKSGQAAIRTAWSS